VKGEKMFTTAVSHTYQIEERLHKKVEFLKPIEKIVDPEVERLLASLSPDQPWGDRQLAAKELGYQKAEGALSGLLNALETDNFWMVRFSIIQALVMIGDPRAIPTLKAVASTDTYQSVRSYAAKAVERLS
jgi:HEAT repeat protein